MKESFITEIYVESSRNVKKLKIPLSKEKRQHLIFTGKNGSGKTSLLLELNKYLSQIESGNIQDYLDYINSIEDYKSQLKIEKNPSRILQLEDIVKRTKSIIINQFGGTTITFSTENLDIHNKSQKGEFLLTFFDSKRLSNLTIPKGINKFELQKKYSLNQKANSQFIQYIVNLKADRSFARDDNEMDAVKKIDEWFTKFEKRLQSIFGNETLKLHFNRKLYNFDLIMEGVEPFTFNNLSDGYSAIISIISELLLRMEAHNVKSYDLEGVVIIDEIETHLHVDLQKKILPFLVDFFPKLQFIVTTHSPFVLSSLSNATICDLETRTITTDLSSYSYDALIESYFKSDKYSIEIKQKIINFENLLEQEKRTQEEDEKLRYLRKYFAHAPKYLSNELLVKLQQIQLNELNN